MEIKIDKSGVSGVVISITGTADGSGVIVVGPIVLAGADAGDGSGGGGQNTSTETGGGGQNTSTETGG
jgi:hypothetical protein